MADEKKLVRSGKFSSDTLLLEGSLLNFSSPIFFLMKAGHNNKYQVLARFGLLLFTLYEIVFSNSLTFENFSLELLAHDIPLTISERFWLHCDSKMVLPFLTAVKAHM